MAGKGFAHVVSALVFHAGIAQHILQNSQISPVAWRLWGHLLQKKVVAPLNYADAPDRIDSQHNILIFCQTTEGWSGGSV